MSMYNSRGGGGGGPGPCDYCRQAPKFIENNGRVHDFCGKACAEKAKKDTSSGGGGWFSGWLGGGSSANTSGGGGTNSYSGGGSGGGRSSRANSYNTTRSSGGGRPGPTVGMCDICHTRPKFQEQGPGGKVIVHPYCGRKCAAPRCLYSNCSKITGDGELYCGEKHAKKAVADGEAKGCSHCGVFPVTPGFDFCSKKCGILAQQARDSSPLVELHQASPLAQEIFDGFTRGWKSNQSREPPTVNTIFRINLAKKYQKRFEDARRRVGAGAPRTAYYGGQCICDIGTPGNSAQFCNWGSCAICIVALKAFDILEFGNTQHNGSLGPGLYAHMNPAKAHDHTVGKASTPCRAIIVCDVVIPPEGKPDKKFDAHVDPETGRVWCSSKDMIIPKFLIIYTPPPPPPFRP